MTGDLSMTVLIAVIAAALAGFVFGAAYFHALRRTADLVGERRGWLGPAALTVARIAGAVMLFTLLARLGGALPLLAGFLGFVAARARALHSARRAG